MAERMLIGGMEITAVSSHDDDGAEMIHILMVPTGAGTINSVIVGISPETGGASANVKIKKDG